MTPAPLSSGVLPLSEAALFAWIDRAAPGERIAYHQGMLGVDRLRGSSCLPEPYRAELDRVAGCAMELAETGHLLLTQRRIGEGRITYLAVKAAPMRMTGGQR